MTESTGELDRAALGAYYDALPREYGFASQCKMTLLGNIAGKRVLDIDCRRGKGVVKLSDYVGPKGFAMGVDPSQEWIDVALSFMEESWRKNGLPRNNMAYAVAYPEDLTMAGIADGSFDLVFANSSIVLDYDPAQVVREIFRALRGGGFFVYDGVVAEGERDAATMERARALGNSVQAAPGRAAFGRMVADAGFDAPEYYEESAVRPDTGYVNGYEVPTADTDEDVGFVKTTARMYKPR